VAQSVVWLTIVPRALPGCRGDVVVPVACGRFPAAGFLRRKQKGRAFGEDFDLPHEDGSETMIVVRHAHANFGIGPTAKDERRSQGELVKLNRGGHREFLIFDFRFWTGRN